MAKSNTQRTLKYRQSHGEDKRLEVCVTPEAIDRLDQLIKRHGVTKRAMVERLIKQGVVEEFNGADTARRLLAEHGDQEKALGAYREELKKEFSGFTTKSKLPEHAEARRRYDAVRRAMHRVS